jgi:glycosyltransferase involved in cell wall biosynthesis
MQVGEIPHLQPPRSKCSAATPERLKVGVLLARYGITGVPLAQMRLARALANRGHEVELIIGCLDTPSGAPSIDGVHVRVWKAASVRMMLVPLMRYLRVARPDVVFSAEDHLNTMTLLAAVLTGSKAKISGSSRVTPFDTYSNVPFTKRWVLKQLTRMLMWRADALTCVSQEMVEQYRCVFAKPRHTCVYNIVHDAHAYARMGEVPEHPWAHDQEVPLLVAAGRLAPWKGFADLIRAMEVLVRRRSARLLILGDGPLRDELQEQIDAAGLSSHVQLVGYVENPLKYFRAARLFVLSSRVEGMPNVLVEAMMCGCTPVSTDCATGPRELLQDGRYGYLVPVGDSSAMAGAIEKAIDAPLPKETLLEAVAPFAEDTVLDSHFRVLGVYSAVQGESRAASARRA